MHSWAEEFTTAMIKTFAPLTEKVKAVFYINTGAAILGLGYIVGLRYAMIIACGSFLSWFVFVPLFNYFGGFITAVILPAEGTMTISSMNAYQIFNYYVRYIGIGGIFAAGLMGILKSMPIIAQAFTKGFKEIFASRKKHGDEEVERTQRDIPMSTIVLLFVGLLVLTWLFFRFSILGDQEEPTSLSFIALGVVFIISFLFAAVAARAIAIVGINPVSGMTIITLIISSLILIAAGLTGEYGMMAALLIGGMVCTALAISGGAITDLKTGYWIGSTPSRQQWGKILGAIFAAITVAAVIIMLNDVDGFVVSAAHPKPLPAPQANAMAAIIKGIMSAKGAPWLLYGVGAVIAILMELLGISPLAFALGMYIPQAYNTPVLLGAIISHIVVKSAKGDERLAGARREKGTLVASGFIAGGALLGVFGALIRFVETKYDMTLLPSFDNADTIFGNWLGAGMLLVICIYVYWSARRVKI